VVLTVASGPTPCLCANGICTTAMGANPITSRRHRVNGPRSQRPGHAGRRSPRAPGSAGGLPREEQSANDGTSQARGPFDDQAPTPIG
jgi:hypothetical protein